MSEATYIANSAKAWGKGDTATEALARLAKHWHGDTPDPVTVTVVKCHGFEGTGQSHHGTWVEAEEVLREREHEIPAAEFNALCEHVGQTVLLAEDCFTEAETTDRTETDAEGQEGTA